MLALVCLLAPLVPLAQSLPPPEGRTILEVAGRIARHNEGSVARFDRAMLEALPQRTVHTETPWTDGVSTFEGPLLRDVLGQVEAGGSVLEASALNDYRVDIPLEEVRRYDVIVALRRDGKPMRVRDKGPLWIIYPWAEHEALRTESVYSRSIWQLRRIVVR